MIFVINLNDDLQNNLYALLLIYIFNRKTTYSISEIKKKSIVNLFYFFHVHVVLFNMIINVMLNVQLHVISLVCDIHEGAVYSIVHYCYCIKLLAL